MKIHGVKIEGVNIEEIVIPRGEGQIVFRAQAVLDMTEFDTLCPVPKPRVVMGKGGVKIEQTETPSYRKLMEEYSERRLAWMTLKSLEVTEGLEWETVNPDDPNTWINYKKELVDSGFTVGEVARIYQGVMAANGLDERRIDEARKRFLASKQAAEFERLSSQEEDALSTESGEPASDSE